MSDITFFLLYLLSAGAFAMCRLPRYAANSRMLLVAACVFVGIGILLHSNSLYSVILTNDGFNLSLGNAASMIGLELAVIGLIAALEPTMRGMSAGLLVLGALAATMTGASDAAGTVTGLAWQIRAHVLVSIFSYGLLTVGAIVAVYGLVHERRLRAGQISAFNQLFAPLETTERLLFGIAAAGFAGLALAIISGITFVDDLFAQHLVHKTVFSLLALIVFGALLAGRFFAGWRGRRAVGLYLSGFALLCLAYFGTRYVLEEVLNRSWG